MNVSSGPGPFRSMICSAREAGLTLSGPPECHSELSGGLWKALEAFSRVLRCLSFKQVGLVALPFPLQPQGLCRWHRRPDGISQVLRRKWGRFASGVPLLHTRTREGCSSPRTPPPPRAACVDSMASSPISGQSAGLGFSGSPREALSATALSTEESTFWAPRSVCGQTAVVHTQPPSASLRPLARVVRVEFVLPFRPQRYRGGFGDLTERCQEFRRTCRHDRPVRQPSLCREFRCGR